MNSNLPAAPNSAASLKYSTPLNSPGPRHSSVGAGFSNELDHDRWRTQHDVVRDILFSAAECGAWLTLAELAAFTRFPEPSIGAQIRALRMPRRGGYIVAKRRRATARRDSSEVSIPRSDREDACIGVWEYRVDFHGGATDRTGPYRASTSGRGSHCRAAASSRCGGAKIGKERSLRELRGRIENLRSRKT